MVNFCRSRVLYRKSLPVTVYRFVQDQVLNASLQHASHHLHRRGSQNFGPTMERNNGRIVLCKRRGNRRTDEHLGLEEFSSSLRIPLQLSGNFDVVVRLDV